MADPLITSPAVDNQPGIDSAAIAVTWTTLYPQVSYRLSVVRLSDSVTVYDSGVVTSTDHFSSVNSLVSGISYRIDLILGVPTTVFDDTYEDAYLETHTTAPSSTGTVTASRLIKPLFALTQNAPVVDIDYTDDQVIDQFRTSGNTVRFLYEWLNSDNESQGFLTGVITGGNVSYDYTASIKRTAKLTLIDPQAQGFDYQSDRIKIYVGVQMPNMTWEDRPIGVFLLSSPTRHYSNGLVTRSCDCYDQAQVLIDDVVGSTYTLQAGVQYTDAIGALLNKMSDVNMTESERTLPVAKLWAPGTTKMQIVADLLSAINYGSLWFDGNGVAQVQPYSEPNATDSFITYDTTDRGVMSPEFDETLDLFSVPNTFIFTISATDMPLAYTKFVNADPSSPVSTVSRGRSIVAFDIRDAATQSELDGLAKKAAIEAASVYASVNFSTVIVPFHSERSIVTVQHDGLGISTDFAEQSWSITLAPGGSMTHNLRKLVNISASSSDLSN